MKLPGQGTSLFTGPLCFSALSHPAIKDDILAQRQGQHLYQNKPWKFGQCFYYASINSRSLSFKFLDKDDPWSLEQSYVLGFRTWEQRTANSSLSGPYVNGRQCQGSACIRTCIHELPYLGSYIFLDSPMKGPRAVEQLIYGLYVIGQLYKGLACYWTALSRVWMMSNSPIKRLNEVEQPN